MSNTILHKTQTQHEKVLLVVVYFKNDRLSWTPEDITQEMKALVVSCGAQVVESVIVKLVTPNAGYLIGEGKIQEIVDTCAGKGIDTVIFSYDLKGSQQRNLEEAIKIKIIDRTQLILDIFARRATSQEGKIQVELAQLEYLLPRLVGKGIELSRLGGGIGTMGPGETKLEMDRRRIFEKITHLRDHLKEVSESRTLKRKKRVEKGIPAVSIVGYTSAGKSTLLNALTDARQATRAGLFTTLDPLARQFTLPNHQKIVISDTVGFMHELPHHLIEAFKATLEEVKYADLLLHVLDISRPQFKNYYEAVLSVLKELEAVDKPTIMVLNKIDQIEDKSFLKHVESNFKNAVSISAKTGENITGLLEKIKEMLSALFVEVDVVVPISRMDLVNLAHQEGEVTSIKYYNDSIHIRASVPTSLAGRFEPDKPR